MSDIQAKIEAVLFLSARPVSFKKLSQLLEISEKEVREQIEGLAAARNVEGFGIHVVIANNAVELGSNPVFAPLLEKLTKEEMQGELTRPQLETLTIIAYRGPITKPEIEHIRGVNCSLILRNLLMRGLVIEKEDPTRLVPAYTLASETLRHLGIHRVEELPDYGELHKNEKIDQMLESLFNEQEEQEL